MRCLISKYFLKFEIVIVRTYTLAPVLRAKSEYLATVNYYLGSFLEFGLIVKWHSDVRTVFELVNAKHAWPDRGNVRLNMEKLTIPFRLLTVGLSLSLAFFMIEILINT